MLLIVGSNDELLMDRNGEKWKCKWWEGNGWDVGYNGRDDNVPSVQTVTVVGRGAALFVKTRTHTQFELSVELCKTWFEQSCLSMWIASWQFVQSSLLDQYINKAF